MLTTLSLVEYYGESDLSFYLDIDTDSFDYDNMTRVCSVRLYAEGGAAGDVLRTDGADGMVTVFGKSFVLPQNVTISETEVTTIGSWTVSGISNSSYPSSTPCAVSLTYTCDKTYMHHYTGNLIADIGAMHLAPVASVVGGPRSVLGSFLEFSGDIFSEGYNINATVKYSISTYYKYSLQNRGNGFYSESYWIADSKYSDEFDATVTLSATYKGVALPQTYSLTVTFCLGEDDGLPYATVNTGFRSESEAVTALGVGIKNKTSFFVDVSNISLHYGASLNSRIIKIDGTQYSADSVETPVLTESGEHTWSVTLRDSRWKTRVYSGSFTVHDYGLPEFTVSVIRTDADGTESKNGGYISIALTPEKEYTFGGANSYAYSFTYRDIGTGEISSDIGLEPNVNVHYNAALESAVMYEVKIKAVDSLGSETVKTFVLDSERVELNIAKNKVAIGKKAKKDRVFQCAWDIESDGDVAFTDSEGEKVSLRQFYEGRAMRCSVMTAASESEIQTALETISASGADGAEITLLNVIADGLSLSKGLNAYIVYRAEGSVYVQKV